MPGKDHGYFYLLPKEESVMNVLWDTEDALSASEIAERIKDRDWPASSIQSILRSLEKKNAVRVDAIAKLGKSYGRLFRPTLSANEYAAMQFQRYYRGGSGGLSMVFSLLGSSSAGDRETMESLQAFLEEYRKKEH